MNYHCFASCYLSNTYYLHEFHVSDHYSCIFHIMTFLNRWYFNMTKWNYSEHTITINFNSINCITFNDFMSSHRLTQSINRDSSQTITAKMLFYFSLYSILSYSLTVFQYHSNCLRSYLWLKLCTHALNSKFTEDK